MASEWDQDGSGEIVVLAIEDSFDLHSFHPSEQLEMLDAYLDAALSEGLFEVRLIHGRGKGVQRAQVRRMLECDPRILRFEEAPPGRGGWGATLAWLRTPAGDSLEVCERPAERACSDMPGEPGPRKSDSPVRGQMPTGEHAD